MWFWYWFWSYLIFFVNPSNDSRTIQYCIILWQVWQKHKENLIIMKRYRFFAKEYNTGSVSLSEDLNDERGSNGILDSILNVLKRAHELFFDQVSLSVCLLSLLFVIILTQIGFWLVNFCFWRIILINLQEMWDRFSQHTFILLNWFFLIMYSLIYHNSFPCFRRYWKK